MSIFEATDFDSVTGGGVQATAAGRHVMIAKQVWLIHYAKQLMVTRRVSEDIGVNPR